MSNDVAIFLDLDNLVIGAKQANLSFDINLILDKVKEITNGRIVLRRSYGDWRQTPKQIKELAIAGFTTQSTVRLNNFSKNLADMEIVVDTMDTLIDGHQYTTYVFISGDRDFTPLVQALQKRGKQIIGVGVKHTASPSLVKLCDHYLYYEELVPTQPVNDVDIEVLLENSINALLADTEQVRASILKQHLSSSSDGAFDRSTHANGSFRKFLNKYPHLVKVVQEETTIYVCKPQRIVTARDLHLRYRTALKKQKLRIVPANLRFLILRELISTLNKNKDIRWRELVTVLFAKYEKQDDVELSKNVINAVMLIARRAKVIQTVRGKTLATALVSLTIEADKSFQEAIVRCDSLYLQAILELSTPFDLEEAALALYDAKRYAPYLQKIMRNADNLGSKQ